MNSSCIMKLILQNNKFSSEEKEIIKQIQGAILELEIARNSFNNVNDNKLIDICIHREDEAKARYDYFLSQAKEVGMKVNINSLVEELDYYGKW